MYLPTSTEATTTATQLLSRAAPTSTNQASVSDANQTRIIVVAIVIILMFGTSILFGCLICSSRSSRRRAEEAAAADPGTEWPNYRSEYPWRNTRVQPVSPWAPSNNVSRTQTNVSARSTSYIPLTATTSNRTDPKSLQTRAPIPRDRVAFHQAMAATGPITSAAPAYSQIQPATILPPATVARADGRHASAVFGGASRPATPPPTYEERHADELHYVSDGRAPEIVYEQGGMWVSRR